MVKLIPVIQEESDDSDSENELQEYHDKHENNKINKIIEENNENELEKKINKRAKKNTFQTKHLTDKKGGIQRPGVLLYQLYTSENLKHF